MLSQIYLARDIADIPSRFRSTTSPTLTDSASFFDLVIFPLETYVAYLLVWAFISRILLGLERREGRYLLGGAHCGGDSLFVGRLFFVGESEAQFSENNPSCVEAVTRRRETGANLITVHPS